MEWPDAEWAGWEDAAELRALLDAGADAQWDAERGVPPLHVAVRYGSTEVVAELAARVPDVDVPHEGATPLWTAVFLGDTAMARALWRAGADPWREVFAGWSPGRLNLVGVIPDLFGPAPPDVRLTYEEESAARAAPGLVSALADVWLEGTGLACVSGVTAAGAIRRLGAEVLPEVSSGSGVPPDVWDHPRYGEGAVVGVTDVPGGCVLTQPWGYAPSTTEVVEPLSVGTVCYAIYANPASGDRGRIAVDGRETHHDRTPCDEPWQGSTAREVLMSYLVPEGTAAYACGFAGLRPTDPRSLTGPPDAWLRLPPPRR
ncbi:ankyrin repeat domain-containing protein [Actinosynnema sp. NPDC020468]|uniref:ankyrin repeat domain-containing protein n=1 Tax=Actinosynnema sp. NPDC020468 TaxID=3154488 RepID=UPI0033E08C93